MANDKQPVAGSGLQLEPYIKALSVGLNLKEQVTNLLRQANATNNSQLPTDNKT